ncbi:MAG: Ig-like domain-containing protein, partial [Bacteroidota bacterium]
MKRLLLLSILFTTVFLLDAQTFGPVSSNQTNVDPTSTLRTTGDYDVAMTGSGKALVAWTEIRELITAGPSNFEYYIIADVYDKGQLRSSGSHQIGVNFTSPPSNDGALFVNACATDIDGNYFVTVWSDANPSDPTRATIKGVLYTDGRIPGPSESFTVTTNAKPRSASVDIANDGSYVVAYTGTNDEIFARQYDNQGDPKAAIFKVNDTAPLAGRFLSNPQVGVNGAGEFVVIYERGLSTNRDIAGRRFAANGSPFGGAFTVASASGNQANASIAMAKTNSGSPYVISWVNYNSSPITIRAQQRTLGQGSSPSFQVNTTSVSNVNTTDASINLDGDFTVAWSRSSFTTEQYAQRFTNTGTNTRATLGDEISFSSGSELTVAMSDEPDDYHVFINIGNVNQSTLLMSAYAQDSPPSITTFTPADNATDVSLSSDIDIRFNEDISLINGNGVRLIKTSTGTEVLTNSSVQPSNNLLIDPIGSLESETGYHVTIAAGAIEDFAGNDFEGISGTTTYNFTTEGSSDNSPPTISSRIPEDNATEVSVTDNVLITFNENITIANASQVQLRRLSNNSEVASSKSVTNGNRIIINPNSSLANSTAYYVFIANGAVKDLAGNNFSGLTNTTGFNFTTAAPTDNTPPTITARNPADNAVNVPIASNVVITFSENISIANGSQVQLRRVSNNSEVAATKSRSGTNVTINPNSNLASNTAYYIYIANGAIKDIAGNNFVGITGNTAYNFTTAAPADNTPPMITARNPADDATDVAVNTNVTITFSENISLINPGVVRLRRSVGNGIIITSNSVTGNTLTINPNSDLANNTGYYITIDAGAIEDLAGNDFAGISGTTAYNFTTVAPADNTPPIVSSSVPNNGQTGVSVDLVNNEYTLQMSEPMKVSAAPGSAGVNYFLEIRKQVGAGSLLTKSFDVTNVNDVEITNDVITLKNIPTLEPEETYIVQYFTQSTQPLVDLADNPLASFINTTARTFTTAGPADNIPPTVVSLSPANGAINVDAEENLVITFSEPIQALSGNISLRLADFGTNLENISANSSKVQISGNVVTINPDLSFLRRSIEVRVAANAFADLAGNTFAGIAEDEWIFYNGDPNDNTAPAIVALSPVSGATGVSIDDQISVEFDEDIFFNSTASFNFTLIRRASSTSGILQQNRYRFFNNEITVDGNTITLAPQIGVLRAGFFYEVLLDATLQDINDNV